MRVPPCLANSYVFSEDGVSHVGLAGLELLTSGDLPSLASQSAGITGVSPAPGQESALLMNCHPTSTTS